MYEVSENWDRAVKNSHTAVARLDVVRGTQTTTFEIVSGTVTQNYDDPTRWGLDVTVLDSEGRTYQEMYDTVHPLLSKLIPYAGIKYPSGTVEWVQCGEMYTKGLQVVGQAGGTLWRINSFDASIRLQSPMPDPVYIPSGQDPGITVASFLTPRFPRLTIIPTPTGFTTPVLTLREDQIPWTEGRTMVRSAGRELVVNRIGQGVMEVRRLEATEVSLPAWTFDENNLPDFDEPERNFDVDDNPNVVIVIGTHPAVTNVRGEAADMDPNSKTYRYGHEYGEHARTFRSEQVTSNEQANAMARVLLSKLLGPQDEVTLKSIRNPALDVGDVVAVTRSKMGLVQQRMIVTHIEMPMSVTEWMMVTCRRSIYTKTDTLPEVNA